MSRLLTSAIRVGRALATGLDWAVREASRPLSDQVRHAFVRQRLQVLRPGAGGSLVRSGGARQSWLGHWQAVSNDETRMDSQTLVLLPEAEVLRRRFLLGSAACAHPDDAVAHRFVELCPIPPDAAIWSWRVTGPVAGGGCEIELAIARRNEAEACLDAVRGRSVILATALDQDGPVHVLARRNSARSGRASLLLAGLVLALAFAGWASGWRLDRDIAALDAERESLLAEVRALRVQTESADALDTVIDRHLAYPALDDVLRALDTGLAVVPDGERVGGVIVHQRELSVLDASASGGILYQGRIGADR